MTFPEVAATLRQLADDSARRLETDLLCDQADDDPVDPDDVLAHVAAHRAVNDAAIRATLGKVQRWLRTH